MYYFFLFNCLSLFPPLLRMNSFAFLFVMNITVLQKSPDMHYIKHEVVKNTRPCHNVERDDIKVLPQDS
jgi:hypothetical protein